MTSATALPRRAVLVDPSGGTCEEEVMDVQPVRIEFWGGPACGREDEVLSGPHGRPPAWCVMSYAPPPRSVLDCPATPPPNEEHLYVLVPDLPTGGVWRYRWDPSGPPR